MINIVKFLILLVGIFSQFVDARTRNNSQRINPEVIKPVIKVLVNDELKEFTEFEVVCPSDVDGKYCPSSVFGLVQNAGNNSAYRKCFGADEITDSNRDFDQKLGKYTGANFSLENYYGNCDQKAFEISRVGNTGNSFTSGISDFNKVRNGEQPYTLIDADNKLDDQGKNVTAASFYYSNYKLNQALQSNLKTQNMLNRALGKNFDYKCERFNYLGPGQQACEKLKACSQGGLKSEGLRESLKQRSIDTAKKVASLNKLKSQSGLDFNRDGVSNSDDQRAIDQQINTLVSAAPWLKESSGFRKYALGEFSSSQRSQQRRRSRNGNGKTDDVDWEKIIEAGLDSSLESLSKKLDKTNDALSYSSQCLHLDRDDCDQANEVIYQTLNIPDEFDTSIEEEKRLSQGACFVRENQKLAKKAQLQKDLLFTASMLVGGFAVSGIAKGAVAVSRISNARRAAQVYRGVALAAEGALAVADISYFSNQIAQKQSVCGELYQARATDGEISCKEDDLLNEVQVENSTLECTTDIALDVLLAGAGLVGPAAGLLKSLGDARLLDEAAELASRRRTLSRYPEDLVIANASIVDDAKRVDEIKKFVKEKYGIDLPDDIDELLIKAHNVGDGTGRGVFEYSPQELKEKLDILIREGKIPSYVAKDLVRVGFVGKKPSFLSRLGFGKKAPDLNAPDFKPSSVDDFRGAETQAFRPQVTNRNLITDLDRLPALSISDGNISVDLDQIPENLRSNPRFVTDLRAALRQQDQNSLERLGRQLGLEGSYNPINLLDSNPIRSGGIGSLVKKTDGLSVNRNGFLEASEEFLDSLPASSKEQFQETIKKINKTTDSDQLAELNDILTSNIRRADLESRIASESPILNNLLSGTNPSNAFEGADIVRVSDSSLIPKNADGVIPDGSYRIPLQAEQSRFLNGGYSRAGIIEREVIREVKDGVVVASYTLNKKADGKVVTEFIIKDSKTGELSFGVIDGQGRRVDEIAEFRGSIQGEPIRAVTETGRTTNSRSMKGSHGKGSCMNCHGAGQGQGSDRIFNGSIRPPDLIQEKIGPRYTELFRPPWNF